MRCGGYRKKGRCIILQADLYHINQPAVNIHLLHATLEKYHQPSFLIAHAPIRAIFHLPVYSFKY